MNGAAPLPRILAIGGIRREELAARAGCTLATLSRIARGDVANLKLCTLLRVSAALGCAPASLVPALAVTPRGGLLAERGIKGGAAADDTRYR